MPPTPRVGTLFPTRPGRAVPLMGLAVSLAAGCTAAGATAQLPAAHAGDLGIGMPSPALARGFGAVATNPAGLGAEDGPTLSATALAVGVRSGLDPVTLGDLAQWQGRDLPHRVRSRWLADVKARGGQAGGAGLDVTGLAVSRGRMGFQLSTRAQGEVSISPDAAELLLFGNAGLDGSARDFDLEGSGAEGWVVTSAALAYGRPVGRVSEGRLHLGGTLTLSVGHVLGLARDNGSALGGDPTRLDLRFPVMHVADDAGGPEHGRGFGLDLGVLWTGEAFTLGAQVRNVVNTFAWDTGDLAFRPGAAAFDPEGSSTDFEERPAREAPPVLLDALDAMTFPRAAALGAAWRRGSRLTLTGTLVVEEDGGMTADPGMMLGMGAVYRARETLRLRGGVAWVERGVQLSGGAGVERGRFSLWASGAVRAGALDDVLLGSLGATFRTER